MVWEWLNPRLNLRQKNIKENVNLECLSPTLPGLTSPRRMSSTGLLSGSIEVVSGTTSMATIAPTSSAIVHFVEHEVQRGDCLVDISRQHNVELSSLLKANPNLENPDYLWVGNKVRIPYASGNCYSSSARVQMPVKGNCEATVPALKPLSISSKPETLTLSKILLLLGGMLVQSGEHTVVDGDTLEWLAEKYGTTVSTLKKINNLQGDVIYTGSILKINRTPTLIQALMGRKLTARERNSLMEVALINPLQPVEEPTMENPSFKTYPLLQRIRNLKPPSRLKTVKVQFGDTLADIADEHGLSIRELQRLNNLRNDVIFEGDVLAVSTGPLQRSFLDLRPGQRRTNRLLFSRQIESGGNPSMVGSPKSKSKARGCRERKKGFQCQLDRWLRFRSPLIDGFVSSPFGWRWGAFHEGVDLAADHGTPIFASDRGTVTFAGWSGGYGYLVAIQHEGGFVTRYAHCCAIHSHVGQQVSKGQQVAAVGATGHATGPHLHFEVRRYGEALDPFKWVKL